MIVRPQDYLVLFGRDALTAAWQAAVISPDMMKGALPELARRQGREVNDWRDEQPGKMLHEAHDGPTKVLNINSRRRYYGSSTTSGFYPVILSELWHWTGDRELVRPLVEPAMNTPQFSWVKSRLPREPQPVPPIYQPEVGAEAIVFAARNPRREMYVGYPTVEAMIGDKVAPGLADRYLAKNGHDAQQTDEPVGPERRDNLWEPVPGNHGARQF
jgi:hypothetical protein